MPIQTQRFTPLKHQHYKLATTQSELDEAARRKMLLQDNAAGHAAQRANMQAQNTANIKNAELAANAKTAEATAKQRGLSNERLDRNQGRLDRNEARQGRLDSAASEQETYNREQEGLAQIKEQKRYGIQQGLNERRQANDDYTTNRTRQENERSDALKQKQDTLRNKTIALGGLGSFIDRMTNEGNVDKQTGLIDISEMRDALPELVNGYEWRGTPKALVGKDGYVTLHDDQGPIKNNGNAVRFHRSAFDGSTQIADMYRLQNMGIAVKKGDVNAIKAARKDYEYNRKMADKVQDDYDEFLLDNPAPKELKAGAKPEDRIAYNAAIKPHNIFLNKIKRFDESASKFSTMADGTKVKGLTLATTERAMPQPRSRTASMKAHNLQRAKNKGLSKRNVPRIKDSTNQLDSNKPVSISQARNLGRKVSKTAKSISDIKKGAVGLAGEALKEYYRQLRNGPASQFLQGLTD